ncbi:helix-turn-helix domain-containing protein [Nocardiopsis synnemataformans]|uniref:helix-turn-helix domain-containing protein n=1 Tax=Nocardiopsis synnemataformans TaxID=61305 RepID=UPI003EC01166
MVVPARGCVACGQGPGAVSGGGSGGADRFGGLVGFGARKRAAGAGARNRLVFVDRLVATLIHLRHDLLHAVLGLLFDMDRSTITRAVDQIRALLAERGCAVPNCPEVRLRTLEDMFAYAQAEGVELLNRPCCSVEASQQPRSWSRMTRGFSSGTPVVPVRTGAQRLSGSRPTFC